MSYHSAYDFAQSPFQAWPQVLIPLILTLAGAALILAPTTMQRLLPSGPQGSARRAIGWLIFLFAFAVLVLGSSTSVLEFTRLREAAIDNSCLRVEGIVSHFVPAPHEGHAYETFEVSGVRFSYSDYDARGGFHTSASHGGPIREGLPVRICYLPYQGANQIVRIEVAS